MTEREKKIKVKKRKIQTLVFLSVSKDDYCLYFIKVNKNNLQEKGKKSKNSPQGAQLLSHCASVKYI